jgi:hypothetical protein
LETLAGVEVHRAIGLKVVVVPDIAIVMMVVIDHQTMRQHLSQRLHLALQLQRRPASSGLAKHGHQQEKNWYASHRAEKYTDGTSHKIRRCRIHQEPVGVGASRAKVGPSENSF